MKIMDLNEKEANKLKSLHFVVSSNLFLVDFVQRLHLCQNKVGKLPHSFIYVVKGKESLILARNELGPSSFPA